MNIHNTQNAIYLLFVMLLLLDAGLVCWLGLASAVASPARTSRVVVRRTPQMYILILLYYICFVYLIL